MDNASCTQCLPTAKPGLKQTARTLSFHRFQPKIKNLQCSSDPQSRLMEDGMSAEARVCQLMLLLLHSTACGQIL